MSQATRKIAVFGGTFNPVHNGHIHLCLQCQKQFHFDKILLIPTNIPPHKSAVDLASNEDRLEMLRLATKDNPLFSVSDIEYRLSGTSYTYHTIRQLKKEYQNDTFYLIVGSDMLRMFDKWYRYGDLLDEVTLIAGAREQNEYNELIELKRQNFSNSDKIQIINIEIVELSSTQIRKNVLENQSIERLVHPNVLKYIESHQLYI